MMIIAMLHANNRGILPSDKPPRGGKPITMENLTDLDAKPVIVDIDAIQEFLLSARKGRLDKKNDGWELAHRRVVKGKKQLTFLTYRKKWNKRITYKTNLLEFALGTVPPSWYEVFHAAYPALEQIAIGVYNAANIERERLVPDMSNVFTAFYHCPFPMVKVIIFGQGPYKHLDDGKPAANGLSFSTSRGHRIENSLTNIFRELEREYEDGKNGPPFDTSKCKDGDLRSWAKQGVLLLNATLTGVGRERGLKYENVKPGEPHAGRWNSFVHCIINHLTRAHKNLIIMAWGQDAQKAVQNIGIVGKHTILKCAHPSGLASGARDPFYGCGHFVTANEILIKDKKEPINWHSVLKQ